MGSLAVAGVGVAGAAGAAVAVADPPQNCALPTVSRCKLEKGP